MQNLKYLEVERLGDLKFGRCCGLASAGHLAALFLGVCFLEAWLFVSSFEIFKWLFVSLDLLALVHVPTNKEFGQGSR